MPSVLQGDAKRWQWLGRVDWTCFSEADSQKVQHACMLGHKTLNLWDGNSYRDIDFDNMRLLPGRQPVRYALPPPPLELPGEKGKDKKGKSKDKSLGGTGEMSDLDAPGSPASTAVPGGSVSFSPTNASETSFSSEMAVGEMPEGLRALVHPAILDMQKPRFAFRKNDFAYDYKNFVWQRQLDQAEDLADIIVITSRIFAQELLAEKPEIPVLGTPNQTMACLCLAMHLAGSLRISDDRKVWRLSPKANAPSRPHTSNFRPTTTGTLRPSTTNSTLKKSSSSSMLGGITGQFAGLFGGGGSSSGNKKLSVSGSLPGLQLPGTPSSMRPMTSGTVFWSGSGGGSLNSSIGSLLPDLLAAGAVTLGQANPIKDYPCYVTFRMEEASANRLQSLKMIRAWETWQKTARSWMDVVPSVSPIDGNFDWLTTNNEGDGRIMRLGALSSTLWSTQQMSPETITSKLLLLSHSQKPGGQSSEKASKFDVKVAPGASAFEQAIVQAKMGRRVAATLFCSPEEVGGKFTEGGCAGVEEELCMRSDLYSYMRQAQFEAEKKRITDSRGRNSHIPEDGALGCLGVTIFRDNRKSGFALLDDPIVLPVLICCTVQNLNPYQSDSAEMRLEIARHDKEKYKELIMKKFEMMVLTAQRTSAEMMVVSDQDCKKIHNDPFLLGQALGRALGKSRPPLPQVVLSGSSEFISAVKKTLGEIRNSQK